MISHRAVALLIVTVAAASACGPREAPAVQKELAVAQSAEQLYAQIEPAHREALRDLVLRLLSPGAEGEPVRTRVPRRLRVLVLLFLPS